MKQFLTTVAGVFVGLILFTVAVPVILIGIVAAASRPAPVEARSVLALDLRGALSDQEARGAFSAFRGGGNSVMGIEQTLRRAGADSRVAGLFVRLPEGGMEPAAADELRLAFKTFRAAGKPILVHSQGLYADGMVVSTYELASSSGDLWMQPASSFQVTGLARQDVFFKRLFDMHGVVADYQQRYEYKNAVNPYLYSDYTPAHRESELSWMGSVYETALGAAAADRGKTPAAIRTLIEAGPYSAEDAKAKGLIDGVGQVNEAQAAILAKAGGGARLLSFDDYAARTRTGAGANLGSPAVAVISAEGDIMTGRAGADSPLGGGQTIRSDDIARRFHAAIDDKDVRAIVFRVSSPGGSDTASEQILAAVRDAKAAGKPVVVSMGTYGASGGYWIASQASEIIAEPSTLTGSIGVFGGKFALGQALGKFGIDMRGVKVGGDYADAFGSQSPMTPSQRVAFGAWMDHIYDGFIGRVAQGRGMAPDRVRQIAKGRVWTGAQARALGLVDGVGGFYQAVDRARALAGLKVDAPLRPFDENDSPFDVLRRLFAVGGRGVGILSSAQNLAADPDARAILGELADARLRAEGATVLAPRLVR
jgi:protease-4